MPFRNAFNRYSAAVQDLCQWPEQELDFTDHHAPTNMTWMANGSENCDSGKLSTHQCQPISSSDSNAMALSTDFDSIDNLPYLAIDSEPPSSDNSRTASIRTQSSLSNDGASLRETAQSATKLCPLIIGEVENCEPSRCGPDAPCMNFTDLPPIEECADVPCMHPPAPELPPHSSPQNRSERRSYRRNDVPSTSTSSYSNASATTLPPLTSPTNILPLPRAHTKSTSKTTSKSLSRHESKQRAKAAHSLVEKKYRENLNAKLVLLHAALLNAGYGSRQADCQSELDFNEDSGAQKASKGKSNDFKKSDVLTHAMDYIDQTEVEMRHMGLEIQRLNERVRILEKLTRCEDCTLMKNFVSMQVRPV